MSIATKCVGTIVGSHLFFHSKTYEYSLGEVVGEIVNQEISEGCLPIFLDISIGNDTSDKRPSFGIFLLNKYTFDRHVNYPMPLINPFIEYGVHQKDEYESSRIWIFKKYIYMTNRPYEKDEEFLVSCLIKEDVSKENALKKNTLSNSGFKISDYY